MFNFSAIPQKWMMVGGALVAAVIGWRVLGHNSSSGAAAASASDGSYDSSLVALGTQAALERDKMANDLQIAQLNASSDYAMATLDAGTTMGLAGIGKDIAINEQETNATTTKAALDSQERMFGQQLAVDNSIASVQFAQNAVDQQHAYELAVNDQNLQHLALDFQHDVAKKGIKVQQWGIASDFLSNVASLATKTVK